MLPERAFGVLEDLISKIIRETMLFGRVISNGLPCVRCGVGFAALRRTTLAHRSCKTRLLNDVRGRSGRRDFAERSIFDVNTNVSRDVLLYRSSGDRTYKMISVFSIVQFGFWLSVADSYNVMLNRKRGTDDADNELHSIPWVDKLKAQGKLVTLGIPIGCLCMGTILIAICCVYTMKSVKTLILCKGGDNLSITSFGFFNRNITMKIPLENVSCAVGRNARGQSIPLKVKGKWFHYTLDKKGEIYNTKLFDLTAGLRRNL